MNNNYILEIQELKVTYGPIDAIKGIDIKVKPSEIVALLGANGAGKTSLLKAISGIVKTESGKIVLEGKEIQNTAPEKITKLGISQSPEGRQIFYDLTVYENLMGGAFVLKDKKKINKNLQKVYEYFPVLKERGKQIAGTLSGGEQQMLAISRALMNSPKVLLLDEPSLGLAPLIVQDIMKIIRNIADNGTTVVIVEQNAAQALKIADYAYVLELGNISSENKASVLAKDPKLIEAYLGSK